ncbi:MAG: hypothetical protein ACRD5H_07890 [Nitrososphaerales archaeon]
MEEIKEKEVQTLNEILAKAAKDPEFRNKLLNESSSVLEQYELSNETKQMLLESIRNLSN